MTESLGLVVNPIAGMGGRVGLKGTDSQEILRKARARGADPVSPGRTEAALDVLKERASGLRLLTGSGEMGETEAKSCGFDPTAVGDIQSDRTTATDTKRIAAEMVDRDIDLLVFAGGDGTARDVADAVGRSVPAVGIPAGVKIYSSVFAPNPRAAGELAVLFFGGETDGLELREVMDIDEADFRDNTLSAQLYGYLEVPYEQQLVQNPKSSGSGSSKSDRREIARGVVQGMDDDTLYILGPGTTTKVIADELAVESTLLGVDAIRDGETVGSDLSELEILDLPGDDAAEVIVGVIGGQGCVFGRGNQQLSPSVLRWVGTDNITIVATEDKILSLENNRLFVDIQDSDLNEELSGYTKVRTGLNEQMVVSVSSL